MTSIEQRFIPLRLLTVVLALVERVRQMNRVEEGLRFSPSERGSGRPS